MANKKIELDVDLIGNQDGLTKKEEKELNDFFKERKISSRKRQRKTKSETA